jgi:hypothetical protein
MRVVQNVQMQIGEVDISQIEFDPRSRDDIPVILKGLQHLYMNVPLRKKVFQLLEEGIAPHVDKSNGRPGMTLWGIFVCAVLRQDLNEDIDRVHELVNHHDTIRRVLGHGACNDEQYHYQTLRDNIGLLTPELLDQINQLVVNEGHVLVKKRPAQRCVGAATPSWLRPTSIIRPTSTCSTTRCAKSSR